MILTNNINDNAFAFGERDIHEIALLLGNDLTGSVMMRTPFAERHYDRCPVFLSYNPQDNAIRRTIAGSINAAPDYKGKCVYANDDDGDWSTIELLPGKAPRGSAVFAPLYRKHGDTYQGLGWKKNAYALCLLGVVDLGTVKGVDISDWASPSIHRGPHDREEWGRNIGLYADVHLLHWEGTHQSGERVCLDFPIGLGNVRATLTPRARRLMGFLPTFNSLAGCHMTLGGLLGMEEFSHGDYGYGSPRWLGRGLDALMRNYHLVPRQAC